jgi:YHS domain-containing protein
MISFDAGSLVGDAKVSGTVWSEPIMSKLIHHRLIAFVSATVLAVGAIAFAAVKAPGDVKCPVSGGPAKADKSVKYDGGNVYFCCGNCPKAFESDPTKFAGKAHQQMVATGELKQKGCPFSGKPVNPATMLTIGDADVGFCCNVCKGKVEKAGPAEQVDMVFKDISKGFAAAK